ncbi:MAG: putative toxin-antitoxin system toxin component, PIN family [Anaerolinea sp.]|nr:putative toxin-antitoxin system toxin component, PIN family [Anaerolinea sp.]
MMRVILDTNVIVSGLISPHGSPAQILKHWYHGDFTLLYTPDMIAELEDVLRRAWLHQRLADTPRKIPDFLEAVTFLGEIVVGYVNVAGKIRDPFDEMFLICAELGHAHYLVSGDKDLLDLTKHKETRILTSAQFLQIIAEPR